MYDQARPPASARVVVFVSAQFPLARRLFASCIVPLTLDNEVDMDHEEQHQPVAICRDPIGGWPAVWLAMRHLD